jgi:uncharacterized protein (TIGR00730 family)
MSLRSVCVFCGSRPGRRPEYEDAARALGRRLAADGVRLIYGGGGIGLMGTLATAVMEAGGTVIGVIPDPLATREVAHAGVTEMRVVPSMHARKALMADLADGFIAMPGGLGTFEEVFEILTWAQLGIHAKPIGLVNTGGYFDALIALVEHAIGEGFIHPEQRALFVDAPTPETLMPRLLKHHPPAAFQWVSREQT